MISICLSSVTHHLHPDPAVEINMFHFPNTKIIPAWLLSICSTKSMQHLVPEFGIDTQPRNTWGQSPLRLNSEVNL